MSNDIKQESSASKGRFYLEKEGKAVAEMTYSVAGSHKIIIDHTEVNDSLRGQGIGEKLLKTLIEYVRSEDIKVIPLCPFAKAKIQENKEYQDVLV
ncbi:N-acetyltransferase [Galbibacter sp. BG1]|uniref:GNAT family N-acetyltransferase n=1 Tax=Galbibacter sp. BG1 TaxID=1170699 RepID=UPI0015BF700B|nr:GNAT family N-acetyltransferase [Galbibacter sp. BG1]QLE01884.1 N-acetyltransferase [Galbibacter sp. BG1]